MAKTQVPGGYIEDDAITSAKIADNTIQVGHLHSSHGITTDNIGQGSSNKYYTDAQVDTRLAATKSSNLVTTGNLLISSDTGEIKLGAGPDLFIKHNGTDSYMENYTGDLYIKNFADDKDIIFQSDNGSGGTTDYIRVDGSAGQTRFSANTMHFDNVKAFFGSGSDLQIFHDGTNSYIQSGTGNFNLTTDGGNEFALTAVNNGAVTIFHNGSAKLATTSTGVSVTGNAVFNSGAKIIFGGDDTYNAHLQYTDNGSGDHFFSIKTEHDDTITERAKFHAGTGAITFTGNTTFANNLTVTGNLTVDGTSTTLNTTTLDVEDKNITLNKGSGDTSGSANGAGITIQDAVNASTDATILWDATNDEFDFSHPIKTSNIGVTNIVTNKVVKFNGSILDDSNITDTGSAITLGSNTSVSGTISSGTITTSGDIVKSGSNDLMIDVGGRINLSADDNGEVRLYDGSSLYGQFKDDDDRLSIQGLIQDKDMLFVVNDGGVMTTALKFDATNGGNATFYGTINASGQITQTVAGSNYFRSIASSSGNAGLFMRNTARDWFVLNNSAGTLELYDGTASATRLSINTSGTVSIGGALSSGAITSSGTISSGAITSTGASSFADLAIGGAADSNYDLKVYGLARFQSTANFVGSGNPIQVGGTTIVDASRNLTNIGSIANSSTISNSIGTTLIGLDITGSSTNYTSAAIKNTSSGDAILWFDASNGDLAGGDYASIRQNNALEIVLRTEASAAGISFQTQGTQKFRISSGGTLERGSSNTATLTQAGALTVATGTFTGNVQHTGLTMTDGTDIDQLKTFTESLTLSDAWQDTSIAGSDLATGTYIVQVYAHDYAVSGGHYNEYYSGTMSWYASGTNSTQADEIILHRAGHAPNTGDIYLRTERHSSGSLMLQIRGSTSNSGASNYILKFRRMI